MSGGSHGDAGEKVMKVGLGVLMIGFALWLVFAPPLARDANSGSGTGFPYPAGFGSRDARQDRGPPVRGGYGPGVRGPHYAQGAPTITRQRVRAPCDIEAGYVLDAQGMCTRTRWVPY